MSIEKIIVHTCDVRALFKKYGFINVRLFKGFSVSYEKVACLVVSLTSDQKEDLEAVGKKTRLESELEALLGFYVSITLEGNMVKDYLSLVNEEGGSVDLSEVTENTVLQKKLETYFGKDWKFSIEDPDAENRHKPVAFDMVEFSRRFASPQSIFSNMPKEEVSMVPQKAEEGINKLINSLSEYTREELMLLREKIDQQLLKLLEFSK